MSRQLNASSGSASSNRRNNLSLRRRIDFSASPSTAADGSRAVFRYRRPSEAAQRYWEANRNNSNSGNSSSSVGNVGEVDNDIVDIVDLVSASQETSAERSLPTRANSPDLFSDDDLPSTQLIPSASLQSTQLIPSASLQSTQLSTNNNEDDNDDLPLAQFTPVDEMEEANEEAEEEIEHELTCNICFTTYKDIKNISSSFVTTSRCNHAVCFKCYIRIYTDKLEYTCFCSVTTANCRMYSKSGYVEFMPAVVKRDRRVMASHWENLLNNNTVNNDSNDENVVAKLQQELAELRAKNSLNEHKMTMLQGEHTLLQQQHIVTQTELTKAKSDLEICVNKSKDQQVLINNMQMQLSNQVSESQAQFLKFKQNYTMLTNKLCKLISENKTNE
ncbi:immediate-early transcriptional regulatory protein-2 [Plutella xylostella multiple nucleopolyhedrovirus]|uniref:Immediate-early transcriptional regulatory protein-2 n=1 Tax=Plutella xylostella multiple nucleopolyhedrovirus TaxID=379891 RepID=Q0GY74_9ABAC|nr:immediate-early transcriptional regulatory protein-2 [Plutella xylostella multiple nucleopolyhedrovirus]